MMGKTNILQRSLSLLVGSAVLVGLCLSQPAEAQRRRGPSLPSIEINLEVLRTLRTEGQQRERDEQYAAPIGDVESVSPAPPQVGREVTWGNEAPLPPSVTTHDLPLEQSPEWLTPETPSSAAVTMQPQPRPAPQLASPSEKMRPTVTPLPKIEALQPAPAAPRVAAQAPSMPQISEAKPAPIRVPPMPAKVTQKRLPREVPIDAAPVMQPLPKYLPVVEKPAVTHVAPALIDKPAVPAVAVVADVPKVVVPSVTKPASPAEQSLLHNIMGAVSSAVSSVVSTSDTPDASATAPQPKAPSAPKELMPTPRVAAAPKVVAPVIAAPRVAQPAQRQGDPLIPDLPDDVQRWLMDDETPVTKRPTNRGATVTPKTADEPFPDLRSIPAATSDDTSTAAKVADSAPKRLPWDANAKPKASPVVVEAPKAAPVSIPPTVKPLVVIPPAPVVRKVTSPSVAAVSKPSIKREVIRQALPKSTPKPAPKMVKKQPKKPVAMPPVVAKKVAPKQQVPKKVVSKKPAISKPVIKPTVKQVPKPVLPAPIVKKPSVARRVAPTIEPMKPVRALEKLQQKAPTPARVMPVIEKTPKKTSTAPLKAPAMPVSARPPAPQAAKPVVRQPHKVRAAPTPAAPKTVVATPVPTPLPLPVVAPKVTPTPEPQASPLPPKVIAPVQPVPASTPKASVSVMPDPVEEEGLFGGLTNTFRKLLTDDGHTSSAPKPVAPKAPAGPDPLAAQPISAQALPSTLPNGEATPTAPAAPTVPHASILPSFTDLNGGENGQDFAAGLFDRQQPKPVDRKKLINPSKAVPVGGVMQKPLLDIPQDIADIDLNTPLPISDAYEVIEKNNKPIRKVAANPEMELALLPEKAAATTKKSGVSLRLIYGKDKTDIPSAMEAKLTKLANDAKRDNRRIIVTSYASGSEDEVQVANRLSLSRSLKLRGFLITKGVAKEKIIPKSMGLDRAGGPADRADIVLE